MPVDNDIYNRLGDSWWDEGNPLNLLHGSCTAGRMAYFRTVLADKVPAGPEGMKALDVGCGCGFLAEEFAVLGWDVTGIDPSEAALAAGRRHAAAGGLHIRYQRGSGESLPAPDRAFDLVYCCDVLEHVSDVAVVIAETARVLKPGGLYLFDTINRTAISKVLAIKLLQEWPLTRLADTPLHDWDMFIRPRELEAVLATNGLEPGGIVGLAPRRRPWTMLRDVVAASRGRLSYGELSRRLDFGQVGSTSVSYMGFATKR